MTRAVIYCRCSTEEECQKDALIRQAAEARECVRRLNWSLEDEYIESRSGTSTRGREQYQRLFSDLLRDKFEIVVIKSQDRLMRNTKDWYVFVDRLVTCGKRLYLYLENRFYSADDSLITGIKAILAEEYSRELSRKINNAHRNRQKTGIQKPAAQSGNKRLYYDLQAKTSAPVIIQMAQKFVLSVLLYCDVAFSVYIFHNTSPAFAIKIPDGIHK